MNKSDRFFKIIYRVMLKKVLDNNFNLTNYIQWSFSETLFIDQIARTYIQVYPYDYSYDEVVAMVNGLIDEVKEGMKIKGDLNPLHLYLYFSEKFISIQSDRMLIQFDDLYEWDGFVSKVDRIIFQAAYLSKTSSESQALDHRIHHDNKRLYKLLEKGLYDNHMHLNGSGLSWEMNWYKMICGQPFKSIKASKKVKANADIGLYSDISNLKVFKIQAIRYYLFWIVRGRKSDLTFNVELLLKAQTMVPFHGSKSQVDTLYEQFKVQYSAPQSTSKTFLESIFCMEREFLKDLFDYLMSGKLNTFDQFLFNMYLATISNIKFCFIQNNEGMGFSKFDESEKIKDLFLSSRDDQYILESVFDKYYCEGNVKGVELRIAPKNTKGLIKKMNVIEKINDAQFDKYKDKNIDKLKLGLVIHYIKQLDDKNLDTCRHSKLRRNIAKQSVSLNKHFDHSKIRGHQPVPVVGIDAANAEIYCPPEVFSVIYRTHRQIVSPHHHLGFTYHVGEDFLTLVSGIRVIDEAIEFLNLQRGDRLGHAIALGLNVEKYYKIKNKRVVNSLQGLVDDIVWLYHIIFKVNELHMKYGQFLEKIYYDYAYQLFFDTGIEVPNINDYWKAYCLRGDEPTEYESLKEMSYYDRQVNAFNYHNENRKIAIHSDKARYLYHVYHYNQHYKLNGERRITIEVDQRIIDLTCQAQKIIHEKVYDKGLIIEVNPTSNRKIGPITKNRDLPLWHFNHNGLRYFKEDESKSDKNLMVCINTDDSAIFETNLSHEYSVLAYDLIDAGEDIEEVMAYIDYLREMSGLVTFIE